jgi:SAM-dependent methyltransferase
MPIVPNTVERLTLLRFNLAPALMLDFLGAQAFRVACAAQRLGVFRELAHGPAGATTLARRIEADERGTALLLDALECLGYVRRQGDEFANSAMTAKWLPVVGCGLGFFETMVHENWRHLEETIRRGEPPISGYDWLDQDPGRWEEFQAGMLAVARMGSDEVVSKVRLPASARRLIDIGGGHGLFSVKFCRRHPALAATIFDQSQAAAAARQTIAAEGMADRVSLQIGDFWMDSLGGPYDVALLFNIVHAYSPDRNIALLTRVAEALAPGGLLVVLDQMEGWTAGPVAKAVTRLQALNMFNAAAGQTYGFGEIARWYGQAGFRNVRRIRLFRSPGFGLVVGTRASSA